MAAIQNEPLSMSIPLPHSPDTRIYIRLDTKANAVMLSLATATQDELAVPKPMGSFVYALPNVSLSTARKFAAEMVAGVLLTEVVEI
jgi:hypothetical protein